MLTVSTQLAKGEDLKVFKRMLASVSFADEILLYSMERELTGLPKLAKLKIVRVSTPKVVEEIRARQVEDAKGDWVLVMDYDEVVTPELAREIQSIVAEPLTKSKDQSGAYALRRRNFSLGFPLRHGGWGDDYVIRLFRRPDFLSWPKNIHSTPTFHGKLGHLANYLEHHKDASLSQMIAKTNRYSEVEAEQFFAGGLAPVTPFTLIRKSGMEFVRRYLLKLGFLDGAIGLVQSLYQSYSVFITYAKLYEKQHNN